MFSVSLYACNSSEYYYHKTEKSWSKAENTFDENEIRSIVYLMGDAGETNDELDPNFQTLKYRLSQFSNDNTSVVLLGDNIYPNGLHPKSHPSRHQDELLLNNQLAMFNDFKGKVIFIPGNHDWERTKTHGDKYVQRQEKYIEKRGENFMLLPNNACPGPEVIEMNDSLVLIFIDTQWWLHQHKRPYGVSGGCEVPNETAFVTALSNLLYEHKDKQVIVTGHHPLYSNGEHGGNYSLKEHIFPLTKLGKNLYVPLPGLGTFFLGLRKLVGSYQDISNKRYENLIHHLTKEFNKYPGLIYAAGHEHNLQFTVQDSVNYIVSGSGSHATYLRHNRKILFGVADKGFSRVVQLKNGEIWTEYIAPSSQKREGEIIYRKKISKIPPAKKIDDYPVPLWSQKDSIKIAAEPNFLAGPVKSFVFGKLYRDVWATEVMAPIISMDTLGGLSPIKIGGRFQTKGLRVETGDGRQFVLRTLKKWPDRILPSDLRNTAAADIIRDWIAGSHPYSFMTIPPMAKAVNVAHAGPILVVIPDDPALGPYRKELAGLMCLFEERPYKNMEHAENFGSPKDVLKSGEVIEKTLKSHNHKVHMQAMLRARIFDMIIGDWDRHDDQWRWAEYKDGSNTIYKPLPRDRDQAYFKVDGLFFPIMTDKWAIRFSQSFHPEVKDPIGLSYNSRYVDRAYLSEANRNHWMSTADSIIKELNDSIIDHAVQLMPANIYQMTGEKIKYVLKLRRDNIKNTLDVYYAHLAKEVELKGSEKSEYFEIEVKDKNVLVKIYDRKKGSKDKKELLYERKFWHSETKKIEIYGIGGSDEYEFSGDGTPSPIKVIVIGGEDSDKYKVKAKNADYLAMTFIYETENDKVNDKELSQGKHMRVRYTKRDKNHIQYERFGYLADNFSPIVKFGYNVDDGIFLGGGISRTKRGFNKKPYKWKMSWAGKAAFSGAFDFTWKYDFRKLVGPFDLVGTVAVKAPNFQFNFYGLGNSTDEISESNNDHRLRLNQIVADPALAFTSRNESLKLKLGPKISYYDPQNAFNLAGIIPDIEKEYDFGQATFAGLIAGFKVSHKDIKNNPNSGIEFGFELGKQISVSNSMYDFYSLNSEFSSFIPLNFIPGKTILAIHSEVAANFGDYPFYLANYLDGLNSVRGLRRNRFGGDVAQWNNIELRQKLFRLNNYIIPSEFGLYGFYDLGRVWVENDISDIWHYGYGGGIYLAPYNVLAFTIGYGVSDSGSLFMARFGFHF